MSDEAKSQVQSQFGRAADDYATSEVHARGESLQLLLDLVEPRPDWKMLDVATGAGHTALAFAPRVASVVATDLTAEMLAKTAGLASDRQLKNVETRMADAEDLPFPDESFDLVTCRIALHHFPNPGQALSETARVLKPGGVFGFTDNVTVESDSPAAFYNEYEKLRDPSHQRVFSLKQLKAMFDEAGFEVRETRTLSKELEFNDWADRQRVSEPDKERLRQMMDGIPPELQPLFQPRSADGTLYFSLWEAVIVARRVQ